MFIHEMSEFDCRQALQQARIGRLACARDNQPYVVPIHFAFDGHYVYAFTTLGQKIEWMRTNPRVCLEIDDRISHNNWHSIIVFGRYEELPDLPEYEAARVKALELLKEHTMWWEPAYVGAAHRDKPHSETPVFYRIKIDKMTGHRATHDVDQPGLTGEEETKVRNGWCAEVLRQLGVKG